MVSVLVEYGVLRLGEPSNSTVFVDNVRVVVKFMNDTTARF